MNFRKLDKEFLTFHVQEFIDLITGWEFSDWNKDNFLYELPDKWRFSFAVYEQDKLRAFCIASGKIKTSYYIHLVYISPEARGKKLGKKMIEYAKLIAAENGKKKIELRCPVTNVSAAEFYKQMGFAETAVLKDEISGDVADHYFELDIK